MNNLISKKCLDFYQALPSLMKSNPKKFWSVFKSVSKSSTIPNKMKWTRDSSMTIADNPTDIANLLNDYFYTMLKPPLSNEEYEHYSSDDTMSCEALRDISSNSDDLRRMLATLDIDKATGPNKTPALLLRNCVCLTFAYLFVLSSTNV